MKKYTLTLSTLPPLDEVLRTGQSAPQTISVIPFSSPQAAVDAAREHIRMSTYPAPRATVDRVLNNRHKTIFTCWRTHRGELMEHRHDDDY